MASQTNANVFEEALKKFKKRLAPKEAQRFESLITLDDLKRDILACKYQHSFKFVIFKGSALQSSIVSTNM